ncbi:glycoside hydrolase family 88 protein [Clostridium oryzae]|uniref:Unsaturated rhamnogalacturonyl hydrolase YesR n=1 Tax=Clostridium oryzae TaxID=1450648 RepID=A0A1V4IYY7_9CLOT|nr:glycoside hydrolase family 88 protein [Clostridium oryzae]OPJ65261.1 unsaturated rhamnogalacturonyl hydrolase YesR [Clostridium oryzae]
MIMLKAALKLVQTDNGLWRTVLDYEYSYEEVSASCGIAAAMINNDNPLHTRYVQKALEGILKNISKDGRVLNVSGGTAVMKDRDGYCTITKEWIQGWGQGLTLAFLSDVIELE